MAPWTPGLVERLLTCVTLQVGHTHSPDTWTSAEHPDSSASQRWRQVIKLLRQLSQPVHARVTNHHQQHRKDSTPQHLLVADAAACACPSVSLGNGGAGCTATQAADQQLFTGKYCHNGAKKYAWPAATLLGNQAAGLVCPSINTRCRSCCSVSGTCTSPATALALASLYITSIQTTEAVCVLPKKHHTAPA